MRTHTLQILCLFIALTSCNSTKYIPDGEYLLSKVQYNCKNKKIDNKELNIYIKQKPNTKIFGSKFNLWVYNLSGRNKKNYINKFFKKNGEEPIILDESLISYSSKRLQTLLKEQKGYLNATVKDTIFYSKKKADVQFNIKTGKRYLIKEVHYEINNKELEQIFYDKNSESFIQPGDYLTILNQQLEATRIEEFLKNMGYYEFSEKMIFFTTTTIKYSSKCIIKIKIKIPKRIKQLNKYKINNIYVHTQYNSRENLKSRKKYNNSLDTVPYNNIEYLYKKKLRIKPRILDKKIAIEKHKLYNETNEKSTYRAMMSLNAFKSVNILYKRLNDSILDCNIYLSPTKRQSYTIDLEGTNTSGIKGGQINMNYAHNNLFRSATRFSIQGKWGLQPEGMTQEDISQSIKYGINSSLNSPNFYIPFITAMNKRKYSPRTALSVSYNYTSRPVYDRGITNISYGYFWNTSPISKHYLNLFKLNLITVENMDSEFKKNYLDGNIIENSYKNHILTITNYTYTRNTQKYGTQADHSYFKFTVESSGSILTMLNSAFNEPKHYDTISEDQVVSYYKLLDNRYSQYIKLETDYRYYFVPNQHTSLATRIYGGIAIPYNNVNIMPSEKRFFAGGSNSIRAWLIRGLGPGSTIEQTSNDEDNKNSNKIKLGDIKLEANIEYRFDLLGKLEGAVFTDIGNIWDLYETDDNEDALFKINKFYKDLAIATGLGIRLDLSLFVIRLDWALKFRNPGKQDPWVFDKRIYENGVWHFAINYPF